MATGRFALRATGRTMSTSGGQAMRVPGIGFAPKAARPVRAECAAGMQIWTPRKNGGRIGAQAAPKDPG
jgi:hypothetical protein